MVLPLKPLIKIIEQPASVAVRFRYDSEGRTAGSIPGVSSAIGMRTYPTIRIEGYRGQDQLYVVVSCVTEEDPYRPHPHKLVGRTGYVDGVCKIKVPSETMTVKFVNMGIQCVKRNTIRTSLKSREARNVDPFGTGFEHRREPMSIELSVVRLCFQAFSKNETSGEFIEIADPVVSEPIYDKKTAPPPLKIVKLSENTSPVIGGNKDIILLCDRIDENNIGIRFYELRDGEVVWETEADFNPSNVHKHMAIWFRAPAYRDLDVKEPIKVFVQLYRVNAVNVRSAPEPFELLPVNSVASEMYPDSSVSSTSTGTHSQVTSPTTPPLYNGLCPLQQEYELSLPSTSNNIQYSSSVLNTNAPDLTNMLQYKQNISPIDRIIFDLDTQHMVFPSEHILNASISNGVIHMNNQQIPFNSNNQQVSMTQSQNGFEISNGFDNLINEHEGFHLNPPTTNGTLHNYHVSNVATTEGRNSLDVGSSSVSYITDQQSGMHRSASINNMDCQSIPSADSQELQNILDRYNRNALITETSEQLERLSDELNNLNIFNKML